MPTPACTFTDDLTGEGATIVCNRCGALVARSLGSNHVREHFRHDHVAAVADAVHHYDDAPADPLHHPVVLV